MNSAMDIRIFILFVFARNPAKIQKTIRIAQQMRPICYFINNTSVPVLEKSIGEAPASLPDTRKLRFRLFRSQLLLDEQGESIPIVVGQTASCRMRNTNNRDIAPLSSFDTILSMHYDTFYIADTALPDERLEYGTDRETYDRFRPENFGNNLFGELHAPDDSITTSGNFLQLLDRGATEINSIHKYI
ncbi:MAG: hypothetical protein K2J53_06340, partial [Alistipes sp.]|nr:hypothetical protein [Alistipes sp.]